MAARTTPLLNSGEIVSAIAEGGKHFAGNGCSGVSPLFLEERDHTRDSRIPEQTKKEKH